MKKSSFIIAALIVGMMVCVSSCKKKTVTPTQPTTPSHVADKELTEDQMKEKTDVETIFYGEPVINYYAMALANRFLNKVTVFNEETTKVAVVFNNKVPSLTEEDYVNIYKCYKNGGDVVVCSPTRHNFKRIFREGIIAAAYKEDVLKYDTEGFDFESWMKYVGSKIFAIGDSTVLAQDEILGGCVGFHNGHKYLLASIPESFDLTQFTRHKMGLMADGVVQWINDTQDDEKLNFRKLAGRGNDISDLSDANIQTIDYPVLVNGPDGWYWNYSNVVRNTLTVYTAYSFGDDRDWYQVDQNITFRNGLINPAPDIHNYASWWNNGNNSYVRNQGAFTTKMHLTIPHGNVVVYDSHPQTANNSYSSSSSTTEGTSHSVTDGFSVGISLGCCGKAFAGSFSGSYSHSVTECSEFSTTTGTSCTINDMSVTKATVYEDDNEKVKWDYVFKEPYRWSMPASRGSGDDEPEPQQTYYAAWWSSDLSMTDCGQQNSVLFYVDDPTGEATVHCYDWWKYYCSIAGGIDVITNAATEGSATTDFVLKNPLRYIEKWSLSCVKYGDISNNPLYIALFEERITNDIIGGANNKINDIGGVDNQDNTDANALLDLFMKEFASFADSYAAAGFTGTYKFRLSAIDTGRTIEKSYTINPVD